MLNIQARNPTADLDQTLLEDVNNDGSDYVSMVHNPNHNSNILDSNRNLNNSNMNINFSNNANSNGNNVGNNGNNNTNHQNPKLRKSKFDIYLPNI